MNVKLLRKIAKHIVAEPRRFDMRFGVRRSNAAPCGAVCCIAGWATVLSGKLNPKHLNLETEIPWRGMNGVQQTATEALGLQDGQRLFYEHAWPADFAQRYRNAKTQRTKAKIAAARIEHFIKTKGRE